MCSEFCWMYNELNRCFDGILMYEYQIIKSMLRVTLLFNVYLYKSLTLKVIKTDTLSLNVLLNVRSNHLERSNQAPIWQQ